MKKAIIIVICFALACSLGGCGKQKEKQAEETKYEIAYELGNLTEWLISTPSTAAYGENVEIRTEVLYDADLHVFVDGQEVEKSHSDSDYWAYSFVMPDHDVVVTANPYTKDEIWGTNSVEMNELKEKYPEYFDLSTSKGLEVYVWQIVPNSYSFGVLPGTNREKTIEELMNLKDASAEEMRTILSSYDIEEDDVFIIPWQNPVSSYIPEYWIRWKDEDPASVEKRQQEYLDGIRNMLFAAPDTAS